MLQTHCVESSRLQQTHNRAISALTALVGAGDRQSSCLGVIVSKIDQHHVRSSQLMSDSRGGSSVRQPQYRVVYLSKVRGISTGRARGVRQSVLQSTQQ